MTRQQRLLVACDGDTDQLELVQRLLRLNRAPLDMSFFGSFQSLDRKRQRDERPFVTVNRVKRVGGRLAAPQSTPISPMGGMMTGQAEEVKR